MNGRTILIAENDTTSRTTINKTSYGRLHGSRIQDTRNQFVMTSTTAYFHRFTTRSNITPCTLNCFDYLTAPNNFKQSKSIGTQYQLAYISDSKQAFLKPILQYFGQRPLLTIRDKANFTEKGGMNQLTRKGKRIDFNINLRDSNASDLKIAASLLDIATIAGQKHKDDAQ